MLIFEGGGCLPASTFPRPQRRALMLVFEDCGSLPAPPRSCWLSSSATTENEHPRACFWSLWTQHLAISPPPKTSTRMLIFGRRGPSTSPHHHSPFHHPPPLI